MNGKKVLVLGGHGFVGKQVMAQLAATSHHAVARSRRNGLDLTDCASAVAVFNEIKPDVIINCAAHVGSLHYVSEFAATVVDENMRMILNLYTAAQQACPDALIINPISNCSYPGDSLVQKEEEFWNGPVHKSVWSYGNMKRMLIVVSGCYHRQHKLRSINLLIPNSYGPGDYTDPNKTHAMNGMIIRMLQAKRKKDPSFEIWGTGKPTREWIYVEDLARMLVHAVGSEDAMIDPINVAQNVAPSIGDSARLIKEVIGYPGELKFNTQFPDGAPTKQLDDTRFRKSYPAFTFTPLRDGIARTVAYYEEALEGDS